MSRMDAKLRKALAQLKTPAQRYKYLYHFKGWSVEDIARHYKVNKAKIKDIVKGDK